MHKLVIFYDPKRSITTILIGVVFLLGWDIAGIHFGVFFTGGSKFDTGILLAPELPIEEVFFLAFLCDECAINQP